MSLLRKANCKRRGWRYPWSGSFPQNFLVLLGSSCLWWAREHFNLWLCRLRERLFISLKPFISEIRPPPLCLFWFSPLAERNISRHHSSQNDLVRLLWKRINSDATDGSNHFSADHGQGTGKGRKRGKWLPPNWCRHFWTFEEIPYLLHSFLTLVPSSP